MCQGELEESESEEGNFLRSAIREVGLIGERRKAVLESGLDVFSIAQIYTVRAMLFLRSADGESARVREVVLQSLSLFGATQPVEPGHEMRERGFAIGPR